MRKRKTVVYKRRGRKPGRRKGVPRKPAEKYTVLLDCTVSGCPKKRWVMPSDAHHVKRCITCQQDFVKTARKIRAAERRARLRAKKVKAVQTARAEGAQS